MKDETRTMIAVYGTLMEGECNHRWAEGCRKTVDGVVRGRIFDTGCGFPMADVGGDGKVAVEVYDAGPSDVARMDRLEGCPNLYRRVRVAVETAIGTVDAEMYVPADPERVRTMREIAPGPDGVADWRRDR